MAKLYIAEHMEVATSGNGRTVMIGKEPVIAEQTVAIGGTSTQSAAFRNETKFIRVHCDVICSIAIGSNPTATASMRRLAAGQTEFFDVTSATKIAVITNT